MEITFKDFVPKLLKEEDNFSTLALTGDVIGPKYETFDILVDRANSWLATSRAAVVSCEIVEIEGTHTLADTENDDEDEEEEEQENRTYIAFLTALRVWYHESKVDSGQQLGYLNILPTRLESTPRAFGPKFQTLSEAVENFNQRWKDGHCTVPGRILRVQTSCSRFSPRHCSIDSSRTFWLASDNTSLQWCYFFRMFYVTDMRTSAEMEPCQLGFRDFPPSNPTRRGGLLDLLNDAEAWLSTCSLSLLNVQVLDHPLFYRCMVDMPGQEQRKLNNPHVVTSFKSSVCHTKVVRVFYLSDTASISPSVPFLKLFHIPMVHFTSANVSSQLWGPTMFSAKYSKIIDKLNHWIKGRGVQELSIETIVYNCNRLKGRLSGMDTYTESHGEHKSFQLHALAVYAWNVTLDVQKESKPIPKYFADTSNGCTVL